MCLLLETIMVRNNKLQNPDFHNERVNRSRKELFGYPDKWDLSRLITIPELESTGTYRCRVLYSHEIIKTEFFSYTPRLITKLYMVVSDNLDYGFKYADRSRLEALKNSVVTGDEADILIIKDGLVTDTSFSNIVFNDGSGWVTPDEPLLPGTKRALYLSRGLVQEKRITPSDLPIYAKARLINTMLDIETGTDIEIKNIIWPG